MIARNGKIWGESRKSPVWEVLSVQCWDAQEEISTERRGAGGWSRGEISGVNQHIVETLATHVFRYHVFIARLL